MTTFAVPQRLVLADLVPGSRVRDVALVLGGAGLTGLAAQGSFTVTSISPVPFTLQTLAVLLVGASLGSARGLLSMLVYLGAGVAGVPWFAHHASGWAGNASFGYIVGFVLAAGVVGELARRGNDRGVLSTLGLMAIGDAILLAVGTVWLAVDLHLSASAAIAAGVTPFLIWDAAKLAFASVLLPGAWKLAGRRPTP